MSKTKKKNSKFAVYILSFMSFVFALVGGVFLYFTYDFIANARATTGTVMSVSASTSDGSTTYKPRIAFIDTAGIKQSGETFLSSSGYNFPRGAKVEILYDTRAPHKLRMDSWFSLWGFPLIFLVVGLGLGVITVIVARVKARGRADNGSVAPIAKQPAKQYSYSAKDNAPKREPARKPTREPTVRRR